MRMRPRRHCVTTCGWSSRGSPPSAATIPSTSREAEMAVLQDIDPQETHEWLEALEAVLREDGPERSARGRPRLLPGPLVAGHLRARVARGPADRRGPRRLPPRDLEGRPGLVPAPVADAGVLAVPDGLDGSRAADVDLPGALHEVP